MTLNCDFCANFKCKLMGDYKRHILTEGHVKNKEIKELMKYHVNYIMWSKKMKKVNKQFINKAMHPRHIYEMKETFEIIYSKIKNN